MFTITDGGSLKRDLEAIKKDIQFQIAERISDAVQRTKTEMVRQMVSTPGWGEPTADNLGGISVWSGATRMQFTELAFNLGLTLDLTGAKQGKAEDKKRLEVSSWGEVTMNESYTNTFGVQTIKSVSMEFPPDFAGELGGYLNQADSTGSFPWTQRSQPYGLQDNFESVFNNLFNLYWNNAPIDGVPF